MNNCILLPKGSFNRKRASGGGGADSVRASRPAIALLVSLLVSLLLAGWLAHPVQAQTAGEPPLTIVHVETSQFPTIKLTINGATWPEARAAAPLQVVVNETEQSILTDQTVPQGMGFLVAIDPNELFTAGEAGQNRYVQLTGALLDLIENGTLLRGQDWLSAYLLAPDGVQSIQEWTQEPNLVFNSIVQQRPAEVTGAPLAATTLIDALQQFTVEPAATTLSRSLLLISSGSDTLEVAPVVAAATERAVRIHVIALVNSAASTDAATPLAQLAQQTGGDYVTLESPAVLPPLWARLAADHNQRVVTFQSTVAEPQTLEVRLPLPTGTTLSASAAPTVFADLPVAVTAATPAAQTVLTRAEAPAPVANALPAPADAQSAAPAALPATATNTEVQSPAGTVTIPGLQLALPRGLLQLSLPILFLLIGYFVYAEMRERRKLRTRGQSRGQERSDDRYETPDPLFALDDNSQPLAAGPFQLNQRDTNGGSGFTIQAPLSAPPQTGPANVAPVSATPPVRPPARQRAFVQEEDENEATMRPARMEDEEATYRAQDVEQPVLGYLMRANSDPNLPKELPIYGLNPAPGEVRQIHIGRHSKHNTVVINDKSVSREHAVIVQRAGRLYLRDNASTSGTFLNWKRLNPGEELLLRHNDLISFGQIVYEFRLHGEDEVTIAES